MNNCNIHIIPHDIGIDVAGEYMISGGKFDHSLNMFLTFYFKPEPYSLH